METLPGVTQGYYTGKRLFLLIFLSVCRLACCFVWRTGEYVFGRLKSDLANRSTVFLQEDIDGLFLDRRTTGI